MLPPSSPTVVDDFTRADGTGLGSGWASNTGGYGLPEYSIASNQAWAEFSDPWQHYNTTFAADVFACITVADWDSHNVTEIGARVSSPASSSYNGYAFYANRSTGVGNLFRYDDVSTSTVMASGTFSFATGDRIGIMCVGPWISAWVDHGSGDGWELLLSVFDDTYATAGYVSLYASGTGAYLDDFAAQAAAIEFPTTGIIDDFDRADGVVGSDYSYDVWNSGNTNTFSVASNVATLTTNSTVSEAWYNVATYGPDAEVYYTMPALASGPSEYYAQYLRIANPGTSSVDGYHTELDQGSDALHFYRWDNGVRTQLGATEYPGPLQAGWKFGSSIYGDQLTCYFDEGPNSWYPISQRSDSTYSAAGYIGFGAYSENNATFNDFGGGTIVTASQRIGWGVVL